MTKRPRPRLLLAGRLLIPTAVAALVLIEIFDVWAHALLAGVDAGPGYGARGRPPDPAVLRLVVLAAFCGCYGFARVVGTHPVFDRRYRQWLATSPWDRGEPLPLGPVTLAWQDAIVVGGACAAAWWRVGHGPVGYVAAFALGYVLAALPALVNTGRTVEALLIAVGLGGVIRVAPDPVAVGAVAVVLMVVANTGIWAGLATLPWASRENAPTVPLGSPLAEVGPGAEGAHAPRGVGVLAGVVVGWWVYCATHHAFTGRATAAGAVGLLVTAAMLGGLIRVVMYTGRRGAPLSLLGRLATGRLVIPGYDVVWVAPAAAVAVAVVVPLALLVAGVPASVAVGIGSGAVIAVLIEVGPRIDDWRLTGTWSLTRRPDPGARPGPSRAAVSAAPP